MTEVEVVSWVSVGLAAVAMVGTAISNVLSYLATRDKQKFDQEMNSLRKSNEECHEEHARAKQKVGELESKVDECEEKHQDAEIRLARLEHLAVPPTPSPKVPPGVPPGTGG